MSNAEYLAAMRADESNGYAERNRDKIAARQRALTRLGYEYPERLDELIMEERAKGARRGTPVCSACGTPILVTQEGVARAHVIRKGVRCDGSGKARVLKGGQ